MQFKFSMGSYISQLKLEVAEEEQHLSEFDKLKLQSFVDKATGEPQSQLQNCLRHFKRHYSDPQSQWRLLDEAVALFTDKGRDQVS